MKTSPLKDLISLANHLDSGGHRKEAAYLDSIITKSAQEGGFFEGLRERWNEGKERRQERRERRRSRNEPDDPGSAQESQLAGLEESLGRRLGLYRDSLSVMHEWRTSSAGLDQAGNKEKKEPSEEVRTAIQDSISVYNEARDLATTSADQENTHVGALENSPEVARVYLAHFENVVAASCENKLALGNVASVWCDKGNQIIEGLQ